MTLVKLSTANWDIDDIPFHERGLMPKQIDGVKLRDIVWEAWQPNILDGQEFDMYIFHPKNGKIQFVVQSADFDFLTPNQNQ